MNPIERKRQKRARRKARSEHRSSERQKAKQEQERTAAYRAQAILLIENAVNSAEQNPSKFMQRVLSRVGSIEKDVERTLDSIFFVPSEMNPTKDREGEFGLLELVFNVRDDGVVETNVTASIVKLPCLCLNKLNEDKLYASLNAKQYSCLMICKWIYKDVVEEKLVCVLFRVGARPETPMVTLTEALSRAGMSHGTFKILQSRGQAVIPYSEPGKRGYRLDDFQVTALKFKGVDQRRSGPLKAYSKSRETEN